MDTSKELWTQTIAQNYYIYGKLEGTESLRRKRERGNLCTRNTYTTLTNNNNINIK